MEFSVSVIIHDKVEWLFTVLHSASCQTLCVYNACWYMEN